MRRNGDEQPPPPTSPDDSRFSGRMDKQRCLRGLCYGSRARMACFWAFWVALNFFILGCLALLAYFGFVLLLRHCAATTDLQVVTTTVTPRADGNLELELEAVVVADSWHSKIAPPDLIQVAAANCSVFWCPGLDCTQATYLGLLSFPRLPITGPRTYLVSQNMQLYLANQTAFWAYAAELMTSPTRWFLEGKLQIDVGSFASFRGIPFSQVLDDTTPLAELLHVHIQSMSRQTGVSLPFGSFSSRLRRVDVEDRERKGKTFGAGGGYVGRGQNETSFSLSAPLDVDPAAPMSAKEKESTSRSVLCDFASVPLQSDELFALSMTMITDIAWFSRASRGMTGAGAFFLDLKFEGVKILELTQTEGKMLQGWSLNRILAVPPKGMGLQGWWKTAKAMAMMALKIGRPVIEIVGTGAENPCLDEAARKSHAFLPFLVIPEKESFASDAWVPVSWAPPVNASAESAAQLTGSEMTKRTAQTTRRRSMSSQEEDRGRWGEEVLTETEKEVEMLGEKEKRENLGEGNMGFSGPLDWGLMKILSHCCPPVLNGVCSSETAGDGALLVVGEEEEQGEREEWDSSFDWKEGGQKGEGLEGEADELLSVLSSPSFESLREALKSSQQHSTGAFGGGDKRGRNEEGVAGMIEPDGGDFSLAARLQQMGRRPASRTNEADLKNEVDLAAGPLCLQRRGVLSTAFVYACNAFRKWESLASAENAAPSHSCGLFSLMWTHCGAPT